MTGWAPTADGRILPVHPFDPSAPGISSDVPLMTGTNLNEFVSGLDHPDARTMTQEQMEQSVQESFGSEASGAFCATERIDRIKKTRISARLEVPVCGE